MAVHEADQTGPLVSVVVPHYGEPAPTSRLVGMLSSQDRPPPFETIVVDDCSPHPYPPRPDARVVRREVNGGFGSAVNTGAAAASGELLLVLNSDIEIGPHFLRDLVDEARPWLPAVVSPRVVDEDGQEVWTARYFPAARHQVVEWLTPLARWRQTRVLHEAVGHDTRAHASEGPAVVDFVVGAAILVPLGVFRSVGGFDDAYFMNSEEIDLQRRLRERRVPSVLLPTPKLIHRGGGSSDPHLRRRWLVESRLMYAARWGHPRALRVGLVAATAVNFAWNVGRRVGGRAVHPAEVAAAEFHLLRGRRVG